MNLIELIERDWIEAEVYPGGPCTDINRPAAMSNKMASWEVVLRFEDRALATEYYMGTREVPTAYSVMEALILDAQSAIHYQGDFWGWCEDMGITPSKDWMVTFILLEQQTERLRRFLGEKYFEYLEVEL